MNIEKQTAANSVTLNVSGIIDNTNYTKLESALSELLDGKIPLIILDFGELTYISSLGLRTLYNSLSRAKAYNGRLVLKRVNAKISEIFDITGFGGIFTIL